MDAQRGAEHARREPPKEQVAPPGRGLPEQVLACAVSPASATSLFILNVILEVAFGLLIIINYDMLNKNNKRVLNNNHRPAF